VIDDRFPRCWPRGPAPSRLLAMLVLTWTSAAALPAKAQAPPLDVDACVRLALDANPDYRARRVALEATQADLTVARAARYPSLALSASAARFNNGELGAQDRYNVGVSLQQILYRGGRVAAQVDAAKWTLAEGEGVVNAARADLVLAVRSAWYQTAQAERMVRSAEEGLGSSQLNLDYAEAQLAAGLGTRPDVLRARVDVSAAELELTRARNELEGAKATLNTLMGQPPDALLEIVSDTTDEALPPLPTWEELRLSAMESREEIRAARARTERQQAGVRLARGAFFPALIADANLSRGENGLASARENWSVGLGFSLPIFEGFARKADLRGQQALLEATRFDEQAVVQEIEREVWQALLGEDESARRLDNARALFAAAQENLEAAQTAYRQGLGSMIALVDARTAFTGAEQTLIQALYDRRIARAVLDRVTGSDIIEGDRS